MTRTKFQPKHSGCVLFPTVPCSPVVFWPLSRKSIMYSVLRIPLHTLPSSLSYEPLLSGFGSRHFSVLCGCVLSFLLPVTQLQKRTWRVLLTGERVAISPPPLVVYLPWINSEALRQESVLQFSVLWKQPFGSSSSATNLACWPTPLILARRRQRVTLSLLSSLPPVAGVYTPSSCC